MVSEAHVSELKVARKLRFTPGTILAIDRGYIDYEWFERLVALLRQQLFVYRDLHRWLDEPFQAPPALEGVHDAQLALPLGR